MKMKILSKNKHELKNYVVLLIFGTSFLGSCSSQNTHSIVLFEKVIKMGQSVEIFKEQNKLLQSADNDGMPKYTFYTSNENINDSKREINFFYAFFNNQLVYIKAEIDSLSLNDILNNFKDFQSISDSQAANTFKTYTKETDNYVKALTIEKKTMELFNVSFFCVNEEHKDGLHIGDIKK